MTWQSIREIAAALGGDVINCTSCNVPGPGHSKRDRSLTIRIDRDRLIVHSHAGDDWKVCKDYIHERLGIDRDRRPTFVGVEAADEGKTKTKDWALKIWGQSVDPTGTLVERYLREHRSLDLTGDIAGSVVRSHGSLRFDDFSRKPGMVCLFRDIVTNEPCGIHRTFLERDTAAKVDRKMLGTAKGAAVKLGEPSSALVIGEGIETVIAAKLAGMGPAWALGSTSGLQFFPVLSQLSELTILEENDAASRKAVTACARRYLAAGKPVNVVKPNVGNDFNDVWKAMHA
jgi:putative DNA primase/helicase